MQSSRAAEGEERQANQEEAQEQPTGASELAVMEDRWKRALADLDNFRKRTARETDRRVEEARDSVVREWLEAVDSIDRALAAADPASPLAEGLRAVREQLEAILERQGVTRIGATGEAFDPELHEAVAVRPTADAPDRTVLEVARAGYRRGDRVLRPAQVVVSRHAGQDDDADGRRGA
jgi:molecular chaperone GrpE